MQTITTADFGNLVLENAPGAEETIGRRFYAGSIAGTTVLVVDDDYSNVFAMTALLERGDMNVVTAESGEAALLALDQSDDVGLVLMDIMMPVMDGYETISAIRSDSRFAELPIVALTAKVGPGERERCLAAGASDYVSKPIDTTLLLTAIHEWLPSA